MKNKSKIIFLLFSVLLSIPAVLGLFHKGFPLTDDGNWMVIRFSAFYETLRSGQFPVRFLMRLNNGYGYPVANFLYPLFMYLGSLIHVLRFSFVDTIKIILGISLVSSSVFCFLWLRKIFDNLASLVGSVFYTLIPYHLFDIYKRGSVGEVLSLAILPFIFWQMERKSFVWVCLGICLLILSHNTLAALFLPVIFLYMMLNVSLAKEKKNLLYFYLGEILIGLGLASFFWIPAITDLKYTVFSRVQISNWSSYFADYNLIGLSTFFILLLVIILIIAGKIEYKKYRLTLLFFVVGIISIFLAIPASAFLWNFLPVSFIQFPFRLLSITIPCIAFLASCIVSVLSGKKRLVIAGIILILIIISAGKYLFPGKYQYFPDSFYSTNQDTTTVKNEYMPMWVKTMPLLMAKSKVENLNGKEIINITELTPNETVFEVLLQSPRSIQINTVYFPGWTAYVNNIQTGIIFNNPSGLIRLNLEKGRNIVSVVFKETGLRFVSNLISAVSLIILFAIRFLIRRKKFTL